MPGANAAERAIQLLLDEGLHVKCSRFGGDGGRTTHAKLDPDEYVKQFGAEAYLGQARYGQQLFPLARGPRAR